MSLKVPDVISDPRTLSELIDVYLRRRSQQRRAYALVQELAGKWRIALFGGLLRDLALLGSRVEPRDIDIVVSGPNRRELENQLKGRIESRTRFGGYRVAWGDSLFDIWHVDDTWAFKKQLLKSATFENLPRTTFFNVEAVAAVLRPSGRWEVYESGFFQAILSRLLEVNFDRNPWPSLCLVRALRLSKNLNFSIGPRLAEFITNHPLDFSDFCETEKSHYGRQATTSDEYQAWREQIAASRAAYR